MFCEAQPRRHPMGRERSIVRIFATSYMCAQTMRNSMVIKQDARNIFFSTDHGCWRAAIRWQ